MQLVLDGRCFQWTFLLVAVQFPIIGVDFIRAHQLLVDPSSNRLVDKLTYRFVKTDLDKLQADHPGISSVDHPGASSPSLQHPIIYPPPPVQRAQTTPTVQRSTAPPPVQRTTTPPSVQWSSAPTSVDRMWSTRPRSCPQLSMMCNISSRQLVLL